MVKIHVQRQETPGHSCGEKDRDKERQRLEDYNKEPISKNQYNIWKYIEEKEQSNRWG
jgi:hypothetical protein